MGWSLMQGRRRAADRQRRTQLRRWVVLLLLVLSVPIYGLGGVAAQVAGSSHVHRTGAFRGDAEFALEDFRRVGLENAAGRSPHEHGSWQRHRHAQADAGVVSLDSGSQEAANAGADANLFWTLFPPQSGWAWAEFDTSAANAWPRAPAALVPRVAAIPLDRPPKA